MKNTMHTSEPTGQSENQKGYPFAEVADLRDYFAAKAMTGLMSNEEAIQRFRNMSMSEGFEASTLMATAAYQIADAMLAERAK